MSILSSLLTGLASLYVGACLIQAYYPTLGFSLLAPYYDSLLERMEREHISPLRPKVTTFVKQGNTLDLAVGTGHNINYYPPGARVTLIDHSEEMLALAERRGRARNDVNLRYVVADVMNMPFDDNSFDTVVSVDVFCSIADQDRGMREIQRVLKPGGRVLFVEHFREYTWKRDARLALGTFFMYPLVGASLLRETDKAIMKHFEVEGLQKHTGSFRTLIAHNTVKST